MHMKLSLVVPCYNEEENVAAFQQAVIDAFQNCGYSYEIIFVDDGSSDGTLTQLEALYRNQACPVSVVSFSRNFGKEAGLYAGLRHAKGAYISLIDADLQQRPELVRQMVEILEAQPEYDIVAAYQDKRGDGKVLSFFKEGFYSLINRLSTVKLRPDASDFRTFRRKVAESILALPEYHRFSKGIFAWVGYDTCFIPYTACERAAGTTKWSFKKLFRYAIDGIIGFSTAPHGCCLLADLSFDRHPAKAHLGHCRARIRHHHRVDPPVGWSAAVLPGFDWRIHRENFRAVQTPPGLFGEGSPPA